MTYGHLHVTNSGQRPVVLDRVEFLGKSEALNVIDILVVDEADIPGDTIGLVRGFPPERFAAVDRPISGFRLEGGSSAEILIGLTVTSGGIHGFDGIALRYHAGRTHYRAEYPFAFTGCAPRESCGDFPPG